MLFRRSLNALTITLVCLMPVAAQVTGRLTGTVIDASGAPVSSVEVKLLLVGGSQPILTAATTSEGIYSLTGIRPESYDIVVKASGFRKATRHAVKIDP